MTALSPNALASKPATLSLVVACVALAIPGCFVGFATTPLDGGLDAHADVMMGDAASDAVDAVDVPHDTRPDGTLGCSDGAVACDGGCAVLQSDNENCGMCGHACPASMSCVSGSCQTCGGMSQMCCPGGACSANLACMGGMCVCGASGQPCCGGNTCNAGFACGAGGTCQPCGTSGQPCCAGDTCGGGFVCDSGTHTCAACGANGQRCCASSTCAPGTVPPLACNGGTCQPCGGSGQTCCTTGTACAPGLGCDPTFGCQPCGANGQPCCATGTACAPMLGCVSGRCGTAILYHSWICPIVGCDTSRYDTMAMTADGGFYPYNTGDTAECRAWKVAATICTTQPIAYSGQADWMCPMSGGFTDPAFGMYCPVSGQLSCSDCSGSCNAGGCRGGSNTLRNCSGSEVAQP